MPDHSPLSAETVESLRQQGGVEIVVGLPSYNNAATIAVVTEALCQGMHAAFPGKRALIVNTDSGSTDGPAQQVAALPYPDGVRLYQAILPVQDLDMPYHGIPGKGDGLRLTLRIVRQIGARVCVMASPDLTAVPPDWVSQLAVPVLEQGYDFVAPLYARHRLERTINSGIVRPLVGSLYGRHVEQPMGGEYACSGALVERYLNQNIWGTDLARFGTDIWTTTQAICGGFKVGQVRLGEKRQAAAGSSSDLGTTLTHVLGSLYEDMSRNAAIWQKVRGSQPTPVLGTVVDGVTASPSHDVRKLAESYRLGFRNLQDLWSLVLPPATLLELKRIAATPAESFVLPDELWGRTVYDFALGYRTRTLNRNHLLGAFLPLYLGWLASFVREMQPLSQAEAAQRLERLCQAYEAQKPYLISRWRSPDRFNP
jgi:glucosylglycerate synthase